MCLICTDDPPENGQQARLSCCWLKYIYLFLSIVQLHTILLIFNSFNIANELLVKVMLTDTMHKLLLLTSNNNIQIFLLHSKYATQRYDVVFNFYYDTIRYLWQNLVSILIKNLVTSTFIAIKTFIYNTRCINKLKPRSTYHPSKHGIKKLGNFYEWNRSPPPTANGTSALAY